MVVATGRLRRFQVELCERGQEPRIVASDVSMDVARALCRELVGPRTHAVVRRQEVDERSSDQQKAPLRYAIWLWNAEKMLWQRIRGRQGMALEDTLEWLETHRNQLAEQMTMVAPAHLKSPEEMFEGGLGSLRVSVGTSS